MTGPKEAPSSRPITMLLRTVHHTPLSRVDLIHLQCQKLETGVLALRHVRGLSAARNRDVTSPSRLPHKVVQTRQLRNFKSVRCTIIRLNREYDTVNKVSMNDLISSHLPIFSLGIKSLRSTSKRKSKQTRMKAEPILYILTGSPTVGSYRYTCKRLISSRI